MYHVPSDFPAWYSTEPSPSILDSLLSMGAAVDYAPLGSVIARTTSAATAAACLPFMPERLFTPETLRGSRDAFSWVYEGEYSLITCVYLFGGILLDAERFVKGADNSQVNFVNASAVMGIYKCHHALPASECPHGSLVASAWVLDTQPDSTLGKCSLATKPAAAVIGKYIYLVGGVASSGGGEISSQVRETTCRFDTTTGEIILVDGLGYGIMESPLLTGT